MSLISSTTVASESTLASTEPTNLVPWLMEAPRLIYNLGWCTAIASTTELAGIQLATNELKYPGLATNLAHIADVGQNTFIFTHQCLLTITGAIASMTREDGKFDRLKREFGKPRREKAFNRAREEVFKITDECERNGKKSEEEFQKWLEMIRMVRRAVIALHGNTKAEIDQAGKKISSLSDDLLLQELSLNHKADEVRDANAEYKHHVGAYSAKEDRLMEFLTRPADRVSITTAFDAASMIVATAGSAFLTVLSSQRASTLEEELQKKLRESRELEKEVQRVKNAIDGFKGEEDKLKEVASIVIAVCSLLEGLCRDIQELLLKFSHLNNTIKQLVREREDTERHTRDVQEDMGDAVDSNSVPGIDRQDSKIFRSQLYEMRKLSATIHSYATLYARVIESVINAGFTKAVTTAYDDGGEDRTSLILYYKQTKMSDYLAGAEESCRKMAKKANEDLAKVLAELDAAHSPKSKKSVKGKREKGKR